MKLFSLAAVLLSVCMTSAFTLPPSASSAKSSVKPVSKEECQHMKDTKVITDKNPVPCDRLVIVSFPFVDFNGVDQQGNIMVFDVFAEAVQAIFEELHAMGFPIHKAVLLDEYNGDDGASMKDNNTSSFNGRFIAGKTKWSLHAYAAAIDLNPLQNPSLARNADKFTVEPAASAGKFVNRIKYRTKENDVPAGTARPGLAEDVIDVFAIHGYRIWGGYWNDPIDFQHFEVGDTAFVEGITKMSYEQGKKLFDDSVQAYRDCMARSIKKDHGQARALCVDAVNKMVFG